MDVRWKNNFESSTAHGANALSPGRRVVVELEGILYDDSAFERWLFQLLVRMGIRSSFDRFHTEWRHDYVADITTGTGSLDAALRRFLPTFGMSTGTIHEVCAAAVCRHRQLSCQPVLFPGVAGPIVQLARWGVCWTAVHRSTRSLKDWERTLHTWRLSQHFDRIFGWPEIDSIDNSQSRIPPILARLTSFHAWFVSCDPARLAVAERAGFRCIEYGQDDAGMRVQCLSSLREILTSPPAEVRRVA